MRAYRSVTYWGKYSCVGRTTQVYCWSIRHRIYWGKISFNGIGRTVILLKHLTFLPICLLCNGPQLCLVSEFESNPNFWDNQFLFTKAVLLISKNSQPAEHEQWCGTANLCFKTMSAKRKSCAKLWITLATETGEDTFPIETHRWILGRAEKCYVKCTVPNHQRLKIPWRNGVSSSSLCHTVHLTLAEKDGCRWEFTDPLDTSSDCGQWLVWSSKRTRKPVVDNIVSNAQNRGHL